MADWSGQDWALAFGGAAVLLTGIGGFITSMVTLHRVGQVAQKVDGMLAQRDAENIAAGERKGVQAGVETAAVLAEGQRQGRESAREQQLRNGEQPVPVADERTAAAAERSATATERVATATEEKR